MVVGLSCRQSLLSSWSHRSARHIKSIHHNCSVTRFEEQRKHREAEIKSMENRKGSWEGKINYSPTRVVYKLPVPLMRDFLSFSRICMQPTHIRSFKKPLILALFFCFKTKVRIINSLKSFKMLAPSIRDPSEYPEEYENGQGSVSFLKTPWTFCFFPALMFGAYERRLSPEVSARGLIGRKADWVKELTWVLSVCVMVGNWLLDYLTNT